MQLQFVRSAVRTASKSVIYITSVELHLIKGLTDVTKIFMWFIVRNIMSRNSDVPKTELQLQHPGYLVILLSTSKKIPGIK